MKDEKKTNIKVGLTVAIGIIILIWVFGWAKNYLLYVDRKSLTIEFNTVAGLEDGDPVSVNGVRKGFVDAISVQGNKAIVKIMIESDIILKHDAEFAVSMLDLMGGKKIEVDPGESAQLLDFSKVQRGVFYADITSVMAMLGSVQEDLIHIIKDVQITLSSMNKVLTDEDFNRNLNLSLSNLSLISNKLNKMIDENRESLKTLTLNAAELSGQASDFMKSNKNEIETAFSQVNMVMQKTNDLLDKLNNLSEETKNKQNNIGRLLYDEEIIDDMKTSLEQVKELTRILIDQLKGKGINVDANIDLF